MVTIHTPCFRRWVFGGARAPLLLLPLLREVLVREVRGRAAVLDRAGELNRQMQGLHHPRGVLGRLRVLKLRERGSTSLDG